jgi:pyridoxamine 5'-phosphate oxidase
MSTDPFTLFEEWFAEAQASEPNEPDAMAVATTGSDRQPSVRMVLLKAHGPEGFTFYTHEQSAKGEDLAENPRAALLFHWKSLCRPGADRGIDSKRTRRGGGRIFRKPGTGFADWRMGFGSVAPVG